MFCAQAKRYSGHLTVLSDYHGTEIDGPQSMMLALDLAGTYSEYTVKRLEMELKLWRRRDHHNGMASMGQIR